MTVELLDSIFSFFVAFMICAFAGLAIFHQGSAEYKPSTRAQKTLFWSVVVVVFSIKFWFNL